MIEGFTNPFCVEDGDKQLWNISSGTAATDVVKSDLLSAHRYGEETFKEYIGERLFNGEKDVFDKLSLPKTKTFSDIGKKVKSNISLTNASMKENRHLLVRMMVIAQEKGLDQKDVVTYPLCSVPLAFANYDGSLTKTDKAALVK